MERTQKAVCDLIAMACWGTKTVFPADTDWQGIRRELQAHALTALPVCILSELPMPDAVRARWEAECRRAAAAQLVVRHVQTEICALLRSAGIPFAILKGSAAGIYYPDPFMRMPGDIDLLLGPANLERAMLLLEDYGCRPAAEEDENRELHRSLTYGGVTLELHHRFAKAEQRESERINAILLDALDRSVWTSDYPMLPEAENGLSLLEHIARHLWGGLGLRQIVDWMLYVRACLDDAAWAGETGNLIRASGLETLAITVTALCGRYLGMQKVPHWAEDADPALVDALFQRVYAGGNFGAKQQREAAAANVIRAGKHQGALRVIYQRGIYNWRFAQTHVWARPLAPFYQIGRYTINLLRGGRPVSELTSGFEQAQARDRLLKELKVESL